MSFLSRRMWLFAGTVTLFAGGALGVACSNNPGSGDGGPDSGGGDSSNGNDSSNNKDGTTGNDGGTGNDGSSIVTCEAGITGSCDIVAQNCGQGKECVVVQASDGGFSLQCQNNTTGSLPEGTDCSKQPNNCVAGLECISGRCSKHCCLGDDQVCGKSVPEGYTGRCDITVTVDGNPAYAVCTYSASCTPFDIQPCASGQSCGVTDVNGTAKCTVIDTPDGGNPEKATCQFANDCKDGTVCAGNPDGGSGFTCQWACYQPPGPFDAGVASLPPGQGGCPVGETCKFPLSMAPTWYYLCGK